MDPLLVELSRQGLGYLLFALAVALYLSKDKSLTEAYQKRIDDNNRLSVIIEATNTASRALEATSVQRTNAIQVVGETTQAVATAIKSMNSTIEKGAANAEANNAMLRSLTTEIQQVQKTVTRLTEEHRLLMDAIKAERR